MENSNIAPKSPAQIYGDAGLIYIRYRAQIEAKPNGQKKIGGSRPAFSRTTKQMDYELGSGDYDSLLMGREFKPGRWSILLDVDNKADEATQSGLVLAKKLNMDQYNAPKQKTPSGGLHYIFYVDAQQKDQITARTTITYQGAVYNMDVKSKNGLCNCAPSQIKDYGKYAWTKGASERLKNIPRLPDELFEMIKVAPQPTPTTTTTTTTNTRRTAPATPTTPGPSRATAKELHDIKALCCCLSISQLDNYATWLRVGMILKKLGAPVSLWEDVSKRSKKYKHGDCGRRWGGFHTQYFSIGSLFVLAKEGNAEVLERIKPTLNMNADIFTNGEAHNQTEIDTPFFTTKKPGDEMTPDQTRFKALTNEVMDNPDKKALIVRSRYSSVSSGPASPNGSCSLPTARPLRGTSCVMVASSGSRTTSTPTRTRPFGTPLASSFSWTAS